MNDLEVNLQTVRERLGRGLSAGIGLVQNRMARRASSAGRSNGGPKWPETQARRSCDWLRDKAGAGIARHPQDAGTVLTHVSHVEQKSGISAHTRLTHHVVLPRATDAARDPSELMDVSPEEKVVECVVLGFRFAFGTSLIGATSFDAAGGKMYMYLRSAQVLRNGPLAWAGPASVLRRCTQGALRKYAGLAYYSAKVIFTRRPF